MTRKYPTASRAAHPFHLLSVSKVGVHNQLGAVGFDDSRRALCAKDMRQVCANLHAHHSSIDHILQRMGSWQL